MKESSKSIYRFFAFAIALFLLTPKSHAYECSQGVDLICKAFDNMSKKINTVTTIDGLENINFDEAVNVAGVSDIPDECANYVLKQADKIKLEKAFNGFVDTMSRKLYSLTGGILSMSDIETQMAPMKQANKKAIDNSKTFMDYLENLNSMF